MAYGRRYSRTATRRSTRYAAPRSRSRSGRSSYGARRTTVRRKRTVSKRAASSARPQRVIIEVRQSPVAQNPIEGLLAAAKGKETKPKKAKF